MSEEKREESQEETKPQEEEKAEAEAHTEHGDEKPVEDKEAHASSSHAEGHGPAVGVYTAIFAALSVFTLLSFAFNGAMQSGMISAMTSFALIMGVAVIKACLVAIVFMHLMFDWKRVYFMIIPAIVLGLLILIVLLPDIVLGWKSVAAHELTPP
ncbi:MAG: hypothetical protein KatS3mg105_2582 [Gemmatales bacterium]|nr:MAG: hypothetical protein KatS3mg105_2582 [Gemmatales bacterium]